jgi:hypothetical protein
MALQITQAPDPEPAAVPSVEPTATYWSRPLQRPLVDPEPKQAAPKPVAVRPSVSNLKLLGTFVEPGNDRVLLQSAPNRIEVRKVGETLEYAQQPLQVTQIARDHVLLDHQGQEIRLTLEQPPGLPIEVRHGR